MRLLVALLASVAAVLGGRANVVNEVACHDPEDRQSRRGAQIGLTVHAGHGLHYHNVQPVPAIAEIVELNIRHAIIARAVFERLAPAVREMRRLMVEARRGLPTSAP